MSDLFMSGMDELDWAGASPPSLEAVTSPAPASLVTSLEPDLALTLQVTPSWLPEAHPSILAQAESGSGALSGAELGTEVKTEVADVTAELGQSELEAVSQASELDPSPDLAQALDPGKWWLTVYAGRLGDGYLREIIPREWEDSYDIGVGVTRVFYNNGRNLSVEAEGNLLQYLGDQYHQELTGAVGVRWHSFPWDKKLDTSFAIGEGLSWHSENSEFEDHVNDDVAQLLNYLFFEFTFSRPERPNPQIVFRLHHRSGVYGLFGGVVGGSNVYNLGVRFRL